MTGLVIESQRRLSLYAGVAVLIIAGLLPLGAMLSKSLLLDGTVTLSVYRKLFADPTRYLSSFSNTVSVAGLTTAIALTLGVTLGVLLIKTDLPLRRTFAMVLSLPLFMPPYIIALSWSDLLARDGLMARALPAPVVAALSAKLYGFSGCVWVMVSTLMPIVMILTMIALRAINPRLEEAAKLSADWPRTLRYVSLPIVQPAIVFAALIVFLLAVGEVAVPMLLRYPVYPVETLVQFAAFYDFGTAAATAVPLLLLAVLLVNLERRYLRDRTHRLLARTPGRRALVAPLYFWRVPASLIVGVICILLVALPIIVLLHTSLTPFGYGDAWRRTADSLLRSIVYAGLGATLLTVVGFLCGYLIARRATPWWRTVDGLVLVLFTVPGTVIGVGLIALWNRPETAVVYASSAMIILAYLAQYGALTTRISGAMLATIPASLEEAAQVGGAPWLARLRYVLLPAALPGIVAAWILAFIFCLRDVGASMLVYPAGADPLPVRIFTLMANGAPNLIAAACVNLIAINLVMLGLLFTLLHAFRQRR